MALSTSYTEVATSPNYSAVRVGLKYAYISGKTVRVYIGLYVNSSYSGGYGSDYCTAKVNNVTVRGNGSYSAGSYRVYGVGWTDMGYTDITINSGGTSGSDATNVTWSLWSYHFQGTPSGTVTIPAGAVPSSQYYVKSTLSLSANYTAGTAGSYTITKGNTQTYTHYVDVYYGNTNLQRIQSSTSSGTINWTPDKSIYSKALTSGTSYTITVYLYTYSGSTHIGSDTKTATMYIPNDADTKPTFNFGIEGVDLWNNKYLKGISKVKATISNVSTKYNATVNSYALSFDEKNFSTQASATSGTLNLIGSKDVKGTVKDSRGISVSKSESITVVDYFTPYLTNIVSQRCDSSGTVVQDGTYLKTSFTTNIAPVDGLNSVVSVTVKWKKKTDPETGWKGPYACTNGSVVSQSGNLDTNSTYDIVYVITDAVGYTSNDNKDIVSTAFTLMDFAQYGKAMAIGKVSEADALGEEYALEIGIPFYIMRNSAMYHMTDWVLEEGESGIWYYRKWASGRAECWASISSTVSTSSWGQLFDTNMAVSDGIFPFEFIEKPSAIASATGSYAFMISRIDYTKTSITNIVICRATNVTNTPVTINLNVSGYWK